MPRMTHAAIRPRIRIADCVIRNREGESMHLCPAASESPSPLEGRGWVTPLGLDIESVWRRMLNGESGVSPTELFDAGSFPTSFSAQVKGFRLRDFLSGDADRHQGASRNSQFALAAAIQAWNNAGLA